MFFDSSLTPKFKAAVKTREQILIESLNELVKDTRAVNKTALNLTLKNNISFVS